MRFSGFDDEWKTYKLKDLLHNKSSSISINQLDDNVGNYPLYGASGFLKCIDFYEMDSDYISIVKDGSGVGNISFHEKNTSVVNTSQYILPKENLNIHFIFYLLQTINLNKYKTGSTIPHIYFKDYSIEKVKIPKYDEQKKIGILLKNLDAKIEILDNKLQMCQNFKKYLMQQIFTQKLRFVDFNNSSWKDYKFKDLGTVKSGVGFSNKYQGHLDLDYNFYKVSDMNLKGNEKVMTRSNNTIDDNLLKDIGVKLIENPSIIFAKVGEAIFLNRKRIAKQPFLIDNNMMAFSPNENVDLEFMYYLATSINFGKYAQTGALPSYNASDIYSIKCKIPPIEEQKRIGKLLSLADNKIDFCSNQLNKTQEFKKGLLQQMFV